MGKIFWSVDEKKYNDQSAHTLILSGLGSRYRRKERM